MSTELANAIMRAEAAEALLEEFRQELETLRAENEELRKAAEPKPKIGVGDKFTIQGVTGEYQILEMLESKKSGYIEKFLKEYLEQVEFDRKKPFKLSRKGGPKAEKDWNKKTPPRTPPRASPTQAAYGIELRARIDALSGDVTLSVALEGDRGQEFNCRLERSALQRHGRQRLYSAVIEMLCQLAPDPPSYIIEQVTQEFSTILAKEGYWRDV
jgi:hypothetical protein